MRKLFAILLAASLLLSASAQQYDSTVTVDSSTHELRFPANFFDANSVSLEAWMSDQGYSPGSGLPDDYILRDSAGILSVDWGERILAKQDGTPAVQWSTGSNDDQVVIYVGSQGQVRRDSGPVAPGLNFENLTLYSTGTGWLINARANLYPVFHIEIPPGSGWTDFELKGSSANFEGGDKIFYYHSPDPQYSEQVLPNNRLPDVYFTDSGYSSGNFNRVAWRKQGTGSNQSIASMLTDMHSEVGGIIVVVNHNHTNDSVSTRIVPMNTRLVWSYSLMDGSEAEKDGAGRTIWRPIYPIAWVILREKINLPNPQ